MGERVRMSVRMSERMSARESRDSWCIVHALKKTDGRTNFWWFGSENTAILLV